MNSQPPTRAPVQDRDGALTPPWIEWLTEVWRGLHGWRQTFYQLVQWNPGAINAQAEATTTMVMKGVGINDAVIVASGSLENGIIWDGAVTAINEVTLRCVNYSAAPINPAQTALNVLVFRQ